MKKTISKIRHIPEPQKAIKEVVDNTSPEMTFSTDLQMKEVNGTIFFTFKSNKHD